MTEGFWALLICWDLCVCRYVTRMELQVETNWDMFGIQKIKLISKRIKLANLTLIHFIPISFPRQHTPRAPVDRNSRWVLKAPIIYFKAFQILRPTLKHWRLQEWWVNQHWLYLQQMLIPLSASCCPLLTNFDVQNNPDIFKYLQCLQCCQRVLKKFKLQLSMTWPCLKGQIRIQFSCPLLHTFAWQTIPWPSLFWNAFNQNAPWSRCEAAD